MGLDITAYSHLEPVGLHTDSWCENGDHIYACAYDSFPASFRGLPVRARNRGWLIGGCFTRTERTEEYDFSAGPYSAYGRWRDELRRQFNEETNPDQPFYELIRFADNEGCIGPVAAQELLFDFERLEDRYSPAAPYEGWHRDRYQDWMRACRLAASDGLIRFH